MRKNLAFEKMLVQFNSGRKTGSQTYFAEKFKIPVQTVSAWINGRSIPTKENIAQLSKIFNKSQKEIQNIFVQNSSEESVIEGMSSKCKERINFLEEKNKFLEKQVKFLEEQVGFYEKQICEMKNKLNKKK